MQHGPRSVIRQIPRRTRRLILAAMVIAVVAVGMIPVTGHFTHAQANEDSPACKAAVAAQADHNRSTEVHNAKPKEYPTAAQAQQYIEEGLALNEEKTAIDAAGEEACTSSSGSG